MRRERRDGLECLILENEAVRAVFLPEIGGKMIELTHRATGTSFLLAPDSDGSYARPTDGAAFTAHAQGGFDECFPTVAPCSYRAPTGETVALPDHGELWSRPWRWDADGDALHFSIDGRAGDYEFQKTVRLDGSRIGIDYRLCNRTDSRRPYIWSAHPLLRVTENSRLLLPDEVDHVLLDWCSDRRLGGPGEVLPWPHLSHRARRIDFSAVPRASAGIALKCFTPRLRHGRAALHRADANASLLFEFDAESTPYIGIWLCYGVAPGGSAEPQFTAALEPASGRPDSLARAIARDECAWIAGRGERRWTLDLELVAGKPDL